MDPIQPIWADAAHSFVRLVVDGIENLIPADPENRDYAALLEHGVAIGDYIAPAPSVPEAVRRHQGLIALLSVGITEQAIRDRIAAIADPTQRELTRLRFEEPEWRRNSEFIAWGAAEFTLTAADIDQLFLAAWAA